MDGWLEHEAAAEESATSCFGTEMQDEGDDGSAALYYC